MITRLHSDGLSQHPDFSGRVVNLVGGQKGICAPLLVKGTVESVDNAILSFRSSDETLDRYGEIILASGWQLDTYRKNPVIQNAHRYDSVADTIGKALVTEVVGNILFQRLQFAVKENPIAKLAFDLYRGGYLSAVSVGFIPLEWEIGDGTDFRRRYIKQELLEVSAVGIPANPNALGLAAKDGALDKSDLREVDRLLKSAALEIRNSSRAQDEDFGELIRLAEQVKEALAV